MIARILVMGQKLDRSGWLRKLLSWRLLVPLAVLVFGLVEREAGAIMVTTISDAYFQVSVFVAFTLAVVYGAERLFDLDMAGYMADHPRAQVPIAALLGGLPGCGGAIVVVTQYVNGQVGFSALITVLTATMGDAAFLLLAREPLTALLVISTCMVVGMVSGYLIEVVHGRNFMRQAVPQSSAEAVRRAQAGRHRPALMTALHPVWIALMLPGIVLAVPIALQIDPNAWFGGLSAYQPVTWLGFAGGCLAVLMWAAPLSADPDHQPMAANPGDLARPRPPALARVINDTNFVSVWVIAAFLLFELGLHFSSFSLENWFMVWAPLTPLLATLIGFLPGCGPQILVTSLYLTGAIPISALLANALSNDGDALFPAIALAPRAALVATIYTGIPALIVGYTAYFLFD